MKCRIAFPLIATLIALPILSISCSTVKNIGGADLRLEGVSLGDVSVEGKPVSGLPSKKVSLLLDVSAKEITVEYNDDGVILTAEPSGATVEIKESGVVVKGVKSEQVKVEWADSK